MEYTSDFLHDAAAMQKAYKRHKRNKTLTKKTICDVCIPFRDKYGLNDIDTLIVAQEKMNLSEMLRLADVA